jgi:beta-carotene ketolase (CrtW type)
MSSRKKIQPLVLFQTLFKNSQGLLFAFSIISFWVILMIFGLSQFEIETPLSFTKIFQIILLSLSITFLYTGLFITAHDSMHGTVFPTDKTINDGIGTLCVFLFALFSYDTLKKEHLKHHLNPASKEDPDFTKGKQSLIPWYFNFMFHYLSWPQFIAMCIVGQLFISFFHVQPANIIFFWVLPSFLSTIQLFYFGTYLPHKEPKEGYTNEHNASSLHLPEWLSFLACYHFGYHLEHHLYPQVPWWRLPQKRIKKQ